MRCFFRTVRKRTHEFGISNRISFSETLSKVVMRFKGYKNIPINVEKTWMERRTLLHVSSKLEGSKNTKSDLPPTKEVISRGDVNSQLPWKAFHLIFSSDPFVISGAGRRNRFALLPAAANRFKRSTINHKFLSSRTKNIFNDFQRLSTRIFRVKFNADVSCFFSFHGADRKNVRFTWREVLWVPTQAFWSLPWKS